MDLVQIHIVAAFPIYDGGKSWLDIIIAFGLLGGGGHFSRDAFIHAIVGV
jgi:hypothetical protein